MAAVFSARHAHGTSRPEYASMLRLLVLPEPCFPSFVVVSGSAYVVALSRQQSAAVSSLQAALLVQ
eukprot:CAMPEP_0198700728 /NCGR_PEP_ID=MMETSP1468-20131203/374123_1 /TAXON_ID=1461545 /ORGANISM="Mantoniella sp, Strain CCMP1436" /LENGTH=65 /DNA_ID=CAMNT_0044458769 /DNA_START=155 /DNA_END=352 /DNA_ORIENTATION=-